MKLTNKLIDNIIDRSWILILLGFIIIFIFILLLIIYGYIDFKSKIDLDSFSKFGDFVGGLVGSIWTLVGILLLYRTLKIQNESKILQNKSIEIQQKEIEEIKRQRRSDNTSIIYFKLLEIIDRSKAHFIFKGKVGRDGFEEFLRLIKLKKAKERIDEEDFKEVSIWFRMLGTEYTNFPIMILFDILLLISEITDEKERKRYEGILRSTMSTSERSYLYNMTYSGLFLKSEIPINFEKVIICLDRYKFF